MNITEVSIMPHLGVVLLLLRLYSAFRSRDPIPYFISFFYLSWVHRRCVKAFWKKLELSNQKQSKQRDVGKQRKERMVRLVSHHLFVALFLLWFLSSLNCRHWVVNFIVFLHLYLVLADSEILRWLNYVTEMLWPVCLEEYASKKILQPIIDWFLEKYKPSTSKKALVQCLCLGSNPPTFTEVHVFRDSDKNEGLVMELGINFFAEDHMRSILAIKQRDRLGLGMWVKLNMTNLCVDGKVLIMVNFLNHWPFVRRLQVCFVEPPNFRMTVKPIFTYGLDIMEPLGIIRGLDELLSVAMEKKLVWPSTLTVDVEKYAATSTESCFFLDVKEPVACVRVGVIEAFSLNPPWFLGSVDWYVKVRLGNRIFRSRTQRTQSPRWDEEFKMPVTAWKSLNKIIVEVCYKGFLVDKIYGWSSLDINAVRDGRSHFGRLPLRSNKRPYLHLSVALLESNVPALTIVPMEDCQLPYEARFSVDEVEYVGYATVEVIEALVSIRSTFPGSIDPYVMGQMGTYRFRTETQYKAEAPKWHEEFRVPILTSGEPSILYMEVRNKRHFGDDSLGTCGVNINNVVDGKRHDLWLPLKDVWSGRLHVAITASVFPNKQVKVLCRDFLTRAMSGCP